MSSEHVTNTPLVSVVLSVYNGEKYVQEAIKSILNQDYQNTELIVIDDGSIDGTLEIIESISDARIRLTKNDRNLGLAKSLNKGLEQANGKYIARLDADDVSEPSRIGRQVAYLENNSHIMLVGTFAKHIDDSGAVLSTHDMPVCDRAIKWYMLFLCPFYHSAVMFNRCVIIENVGYYNVRFDYSEDYEYWWRICAKYHVSNLDYYLTNYRLSDSSMTSSQTSFWTKGQIFSFEKVSGFLNWNEQKHADTKKIYQLMCKIITTDISYIEAGYLEFIYALFQIRKLNDSFNDYYNLSFPRERSNHLEIASTRVKRPKYFINSGKAFLKFIRHKTFHN